MTSTPYVHVEELTRQLRRELLEDLKPILESQGIQFLDIARVVMREEEHRSCIDSIAMTPNTTEPTDQVLGVDDHRGSLR
jgi:hypothetical protein